MFTKQSPFKEDNPNFRAFDRRSPSHNNLSLSENDDFPAQHQNNINSYVPQNINRDTEPTSALRSLNVNKQHNPMHPILENQTEVEVQETSNHTDENKKTPS